MPDCFELEPERFPTVIPLYRAAQICFPLIFAVLEQRQRGQVFVDNPNYPESALVVTDFGFMNYIGGKRDNDFDAGLARLFAAGGALRPSYLLWYSPPAQWQKRLDALGPDSVRRRERTRFAFQQNRTDCLSEPTECPAGFELRNLDKDLIQKTRKLGINIDSRFWSSAQDFCEHGLGVGLLKDGEVVSLCYAACVADSLAEIDIVTQPEYRRRALGECVARQFIKECVHKAITPTWDCFEGNTASLRLAEKLGFEAIRTYPMYSFNVPLEFKKSA